MPKKISTVIAYSIVLLAALAHAQRTVPFTMAAAGEAIAEIAAAAPGASWEKGAAEGATITVALDGAYNQDIQLVLGGEPFTHRVFLGTVSAGQHQLTLTRNPQLSAAGAGFEMRDAKVRALAPNDPEAFVITHAPILYARADTLGRFTDAPLLMWYERLHEAQGDVLQYSIIFTNEDGGTPSDALMARWGRGTDIEYIYRLELDSAGNVRDEIYQAPDHKDLRFRGKKIGQHPVFLVATLNNTFTDGGFTSSQYRFVPQFADLAGKSREMVMDANPWTYRVMAQELGREAKLRAWGVQQPPNIGDPRSYLYLDLDVQVRGAAGIAAWARRKDDPHWYSSHRGRLDFAINRNGVVRTTIELPPGSSAADLADVAIECLDLRDPRVSNPGPAGECTLGANVKALLLDSEYKPGPNLLGASPGARLKLGEMISVPVR